MWPALSILSFFVGGVLLLLVSVSLFDTKRELKSSIFFLAILTISGVQRVVFGLSSFKILGPIENPFEKSLLFAFFIPPIYYLFFEGLLYQKIARKNLPFHFGISFLLVGLSLGLDWNKSINQTVFLVYSTGYILRLIYLVWTYFAKRKSQRELGYFKSIRVWAYLMMVAFLLIYAFANFIYGKGLEDTQDKMLGEFYGLTSLLWLFIAFYLLRNPRILYGELRLLEHINAGAPEEIAIWRSKKKGQTSTQDLGVEKQIAPRVETLLFALKKMEQAWSEELLEVPSLKSLSFQLDCPQSHVKYLFKYYGNFTYGEYVNVLRINYSISLIRKGYLLTHTIDSLSKKTLFVSGNTFYLNFKKLTGESPSEYHAHLQQEKRGAVEG
jgi:AraC-like DNA-binding protein